MVHAAGQDRPDVAEKRRHWKQEQPARSGPQLIFIDQTRAKTNMTRTCGQAPVGERLVARVPQGHWQTTTLIAALCTRGIHCSTVVDGAVNADVFAQQVLVLQLQSGGVIVIDNLWSHKSARTRQRIEPAGARLLFLPPHSPDLNPIGTIFARIKQLPCSLACRTKEALWNPMQQVLNQVSASDSANCFDHCGYTLQLD